MRHAFQFLRKTGVWAPILVLILHEVLSSKEWRAEIDWFNHFCGGLSFSYFSWKSLPFLSRWTGKILSPGRLLIGFLSGCTAALLWEIAEFSSDLFLHTHIQKSIPETMMDIVNGFLGTSTMIAILFLWEVRRCWISKKFNHL